MNLAVTIAIYCDVEICDAEHRFYIDAAVAWDLLSCTSKSNWLHRVCIVGAGSDNTQL